MNPKIDTDDIQMQQMIEELKRLWSFLQPRDKDIFLEKMAEEIENLKKEKKLTLDDKINILIEHNIIPENTRNIGNGLKKMTLIEYSHYFKDNKFIGEQIEKEQPTQEPLQETQDNTKEQVAEETEQTQEIQPQEPNTQEIQEQETLAQETQIEESVTNSIADNTNQLQQESKELDNLVQEQEATLKDISKETQSFDDKIQETLNEILEKHKEDFKEIGIYKEHTQGDKTYKIFDDQAVLPQEERDRLQKEYENAPNKQEWQPNIAFDIDSFKAKHQESQNFINDFMQEVREISGKSPSMEQEKKLNPNTYFTDLADWFEKKKMENKEMPISKDEFKKEFYEYCKNGMSENEMKILLTLANKEPSILSKEHKDMINQGLKYNLQNNNLLDHGLETAINAQLDKEVNTKNAKDFIDFAIKTNKSDNIVDKTMNEFANNKIAEKIKKSPNVNLNDENTKKLNAIIKNDLASLSKTQNQSKGRSR